MDESPEKLSEILKIVESCRKEEYQQVIAKRRDYDIMYHLSPARANLVSWLPINENHRVLEAGAECGSLTECLAAMAGEVTALERSETKLRINELRNRDKKNISYVSGELSAAERGSYDWIILTGKELSFLETLLPYLAADGRLVLAVSNCFGIRRWAGAPEENEDVSKKEILKRLKDAGCEETEIYYPYPDYEFPMAVYSEAFLPRIGELRHNRRNFKGERYEFFSEREAFDKVIEKEMFDEYANAYLILTGKAAGMDKRIYVKYSDERSRKFMIRTDINIDEKGKKYVSKRAIVPEGVSHLRHILNCHKALKERYSRSGFFVNKCRAGEDLRKDGLSFEYLDGESLSDVIKREKSSERRRELLKRYRKYLTYGCQTEPFQISDDFRRVFGDRKLPEHLMAARGLDIDMIFPNIMVSKDGWHLIDYEWTFDFLIPVNFILYRAYLYESLEQPDNEEVSLDKLKEVGLLEDVEEEIYWEMEKSFQAYILDGMTPTRDMQQLIGYAVKDVPYMEAEVERLTKEWKRVHEELVQCDAQLSAIKASRTWKLHEKLRRRIK